jgi:hypothetical protein
MTVILVIVGIIIIYKGYKYIVQTNSEFSHIEIAGVTFSNDDGTSRQLIISKLNKSDKLKLKPDPSNPHDENAIAVLNMRGLIVGWIPRGINIQVLELLKENKIKSVIVAEIYGFDILGVQIELELKEGSI